MALLAAPFAAHSQQSLTCQAGRCVQALSGKARIGQQLRVNARGPVTLEAGAEGSNELSYTVRIVVRARDEAEARRIIEGRAVRVESEGGWSVVNVPFEQISTMVLRAPRLRAASVVTSDGPVEVNGIYGALDVDTVAGPLAVDRIRGDCRLTARGGDIRVGM